MKTFHRFLMYALWIIMSPILADVVSDDFPAYRDSIHVSVLLSDMFMSLLAIGSVIVMAEEMKKQSEGGK